MNYTESLNYIYNAKQRGAVKNGLVNITELLTRLGNPEARFRSVHVAGTNGKGSVCVFLESMLRAAGYRAGLYTSPYLERFTERIRIGSEEIPEADYSAIATDVRAAAEAMAADGHAHPTFFELVTACCFLYFAKKQVDIAVIETGLGGRTDATNVLTPLASVIATIGIDHAHALGNTIELIATEKAGIIKPGVPCVLSGANAPEAVEIIRRVAETADSPLILGSDYKIESTRDDLDGQTFDLTGNGLELRGLEIRLLGSHQLANAATAALAALELKKQGFNIPDVALRNGLKEARWPGRMELLRREPPVLIDGAHNPQAAKTLADNVSHYFKGKPVCLVAGTMEDKDAAQIVKEFSRFATRVIATQPPAHERLRRNAEELSDLFVACGVEALPCPDWQQALGLALNSGMAVVVAGSLYLAGAARPWFQSLSAESPAESPPSGGSSVGDAAAPDGVGPAWA